MNPLNDSKDKASEQRQEVIVEYLREQLHDAREGMSLRSPASIQHELDIAEAKLKRLKLNKGAQA